MTAALILSDVLEPCVNGTGGGLDATALVHELEWNAGWSVTSVGEWESIYLLGLLAGPLPREAAVDDVAGQLNELVAS